MNPTAVFPQSATDLTKQVEKDLLLEIMVHLKESKISMDEAQHLAKDFLSVLPIQDKQDLLQKMKQLGEKYEEAQSVFLKYAKPEEEDERNRKLEAIAAHLRVGDLQKALDAAKATSDVAGGGIYAG